MHRAGGADGAAVDVRYDLKVIRRKPRQTVQALRNLMIRMSGRNRLPLTGVAWLESSQFLIIDSQDAVRNFCQPLGAWSCAERRRDHAKVHRVIQGVELREQL